MSQQTTNAPAKQARKQMDLAQLLTAQKGEIEKALPKHLTADRMLRICLTEIRKTPKLRECDPYSFMGAVIQSAQLGLEPGGGLGHAYLIPYGKQCTFVPGYKGLIDLARRSGKIAGMHAFLVYPEDDFDEGVENGRAVLRHKPKRIGRERKDDEMLFAVAIAEFTSGGPQWTVMERWEVEKIRDGLRYKSDVWRDHFGEMAKKTAVRRLCKMLPQSPELVRANEVEDQDPREQRNHRVFVDAGVIDAGYVVEPPDPEKNAAVHAAPDTAPPATPKEQTTAAEQLQAAVRGFETAKADCVKAGIKIDDALGGRLTALNNSSDAAMLRAATTMLRAAVAKASGQ